MSEPHYVLIVDDEPRIRTMLRRYLADEGFKVSEAGNGAAMRAVLQSHDLEAVVHVAHLSIGPPGGN